MEKKLGVAKTVAFSPLRQANAVFRNILDAPFRIKWPDVAVDKAALILGELKRSLTAVKRVRSGRTSLDRPFKKQRLELKAVGVASREESSPVITSCLAESVSIEEQPFDAGKCSQIVVGINAVTRHLEKGNLRAGVVCLSAKPAILQHHVLMLAATRDAPMVALPSLSDAISPSLGVRSALAIGFKKVETGSEDYFQSVVRVICDSAPPIYIPWLQRNPKGEEPTVGASRMNAEPGSIPVTLALPYKASRTSDMDIPGVVSERVESATPTTMAPGVVSERVESAMTPVGTPYHKVKVKRTICKPKVKQK